MHKSPYTLGKDGKWPDALYLQRALTKVADDCGVDLVLCSGRLGAAIAEGAGERGRWFASVDELNRHLPELIREEDRVLVKASRGMRFERIAEALKCL